MNHILGVSGSEISDMKAEQGYEAISKSPIEEYPWRWLNHSTNSEFQYPEGGMFVAETGYNKPHFRI